MFLVKESLVSNPLPHVLQMEYGCVLKVVCSTFELVNYIFLWVPTHIGLRYTSNYRYTNVNLVPTI